MNLRSVRRSGLPLLLLRVACALADASLTAAAQAMSFVPMSDEALLEQADTVVLARVLAVEPAPGHELAAMRYRLQIEEVLKGGPGANVIGVWAPGTADRLQPDALIIPGAPPLEPGARVLAFLNPRGDGDYVLTQWSLGLFHVAHTVSGVAVLVRALAQADALSFGGAKSYVQSEQSRYRKLDAFRQWLRLRAAGGSVPAVYWTNEALAESIQPRYATADPPARWVEFEQGRSVTFYATTPGQDDMPGGGYAEFQQALAAWDRNPAGRVNYVYGGLTSASGDLAHPDGINKILFNDPNDYIGGTRMDGFESEGGGRLVALQRTRRGWARDRVRARCHSRG
jgi:hypothetical protein